MTHTCERCGVMIPKGEPYFDVRLSVISGYDEAIKEDEDRHIETVLNEIKDRATERLEEEIAFVREAVVCTGCREVIVDFYKEVLGERQTRFVPGSSYH